MKDETNNEALISNRETHEPQKFNRRTVLGVIGASAALTGFASVPARGATETLSGYVGSYRAPDFESEYVVTFYRGLSEAFCPRQDIARYYGYFTDAPANNSYTHIAVPADHPTTYEAGDRFFVTNVQYCPYGGWYTADITPLGTTEPENTPPTASFTFTPESPEVGEEIAFDASGSTDSEGPIVTYAWDFGDGQITTEQDPTVTHEYTDAGDYTVTLTVVDEAEETNTATETVSVVVFADPISVNEESYLPRDPNADGKFEDIDGDGTVGGGEDSSALARIIAAYLKGELNLTDAQVNALDFNDDGQLSGSDNGAYNRSY